MYYFYFLGQIFTHPLPKAMLTNMLCEIFHCLFSFWLLDVLVLHYNFNT